MSIISKLKYFKRINSVGFIAIRHDIALKEISMDKQVKLDGNKNDAGKPQLGLEHV